MSTNEIFNQMLSGKSIQTFSRVVQIFFLQNNVTNVTMQDSYLTISCLRVTLEAFSNVT